MPEESQVIQEAFQEESGNELESGNEMIDFKEEENT
jgi:hypothetical protein